MLHMCRAIAGSTFCWGDNSAGQRLAVIIPITILVICLLLYSMFGSYQWRLVILLSMVLAPLGGLLALWITGTHFSVSSGLGFLALLGVCVQIGVIMVEYINQLRARGMDLEDAVVEGAVLRLRPIILTMLVATLGLLPAALSHDIGSDSQRPFAIVIVGGLMVDLLISLFLSAEHLPAVRERERQAARRDHAHAEHGAVPAGGASPSVVGCGSSRRWRCSRRRAERAAPRCPRRDRSPASTTASSSPAP
jgi:Cu/Ag efflux pump CusA